MLIMRACGASDLATSSVARISQHICHELLRMHLKRCSNKTRQNNSKRDREITASVHSATFLWHACRSALQGKRSKTGGNVRNGRESLFSPSPLRSTRGETAKTARKGKENRGKTRTRCVGGKRRLREDSGQLQSV